jgi:hypothetical protein
MSERRITMQGLGRRPCARVLLALSRKDLWCSAASSTRSPDRYLCVGPRHYCRNRNPTPIFSWNPTLSLSTRGVLHCFFFFYLPSSSPSSLPAALLVYRLTTHLADSQTHAACSLPRARLLRSSNIYTTARRAAATSTPAGHQASMDMVSQSEHLCYVRCTYCNTVLAVNSSRNRIRIMKHLSWRRS